MQKQSYKTHGWGHNIMARVGCHGFDSRDSLLTQDNGKRGFASV